MRRITKLSLLCLVAGSATACTPDLVTSTEVLPYAGVRFINAVPDSAGAFGMDMRFLDIFEHNAHFQHNFRSGPSAAPPFVSTQIQFKGARAGNRNFRIFLNDTIQSIASTVVKDTTVSLTAQTNYTAMLWGNGRSTGADAMRLSFWPEDVANPGAQVAMRVINATSAPIDVSVFAAVGGTQPATPTWAAIPPYSVSSYVLRDSTSYLYNVRAAGTTTNLFANAVTMPGAPASCSGTVCAAGQKEDIEAQPGTRIAGSAVTGIVFPRSTAGARTPQTAAFAVPGISFMWDRRPPRTCSPIC